MALRQPNKTPTMPRKVLVRDDETIESAIRRFRRVVRENGVLTGTYVRMVDRNRQKYFYERPSIKRRRKRHIAATRRRCFPPMMSQ